MANIPVERTGAGTPWWLWLLGLLLLLGLVWFLVGLFGDEVEDDVAVTDDVETVDDMDADDGVSAAGTLDPVAATALDLSNLYVTRVTGDRTFFVAPDADSQDNETLVILDQNMSPDTPGIEGQVDINPGQRVALTGGRIEARGDADLTNMGIPDADLNAMTAETQIVRVDGGEVEVLEDDMAAPVEVD